MAEVGFAHFSARAVAKRIGYSIGSIYNVYGTLDHLLIEINTRTFRHWTHSIGQALAETETDRIATLVEAYFAFARANPMLWTAIYDHRLPPGMAMPEQDAAERARLTGLATEEVAAALGRPVDEAVRNLTVSLIATVHGHCSLAISGSFDLLEEPDPIGRALERVRESLMTNHVSSFSKPLGA